MAKADTGKPKSKAKAKAKEKPKAAPTNTERQKRFIEMAHEVEADESQESFDRAFGMVVRRDNVKRN